MRRLGVVLLPCMLMVFGAWCDDQGHHHELSEREVGSVHFLTSCSKDVETDFNRSVALLHSFQYEEARHAFEAVVAREPRCAMGRSHDPLSRALGERRRRRQTRGATQGERGGCGQSEDDRAGGAYIAALDEIYREGSQDAYANGVAFERKMAALQAAYPRGK